MKLTEQQRASLLTWLSDRYEEMRPDSKSIREEDPHLMPAIRAAMKALRGPAERLLTSPPPRVDGWIPVTADQPEPYVFVLVNCADGTRIARRYMKRGEAHWSERDVTHWQPLPAPPSQPAAGAEETP
jgi:hypothetical protein